MLLTKELGILSISSILKTERTLFLLKEPVQAITQGLLSQTSWSGEEIHIITYWSMEISQHLPLPGELGKWFKMELRDGLPMLLRLETALFTTKIGEVASVSSSIRLKTKFTLKNLQLTDADLLCLFTSLFTRE